MNSRTSPSLAPLASCSRIWLRRSTASGAFDSASDWFWQTRHRSSCARPATRFSSAWFSAAGGADGAGCCAQASGASTASARAATRRVAPLAPTRELLEQRLDLLRLHFRGERADVLEADDAIGVDDVGFRHAVHAVIHG